MARHPVPPICASSFSSASPDRDTSSVDLCRASFAGGKLICGQLRGESRDGCELQSQSHRRCGGSVEHPRRTTAVPLSWQQSPERPRPPRTIGHPPCPCTHCTDVGGFGNPLLVMRPTGDSGRTPPEPTYESSAGSTCGRGCPHSGQRSNWARFSRYSKTVVTRVAWLQVRGLTERGSLVCGWTCSAITPLGRL